MQSMRLETPAQQRPHARSVASGSYRLIALTLLVVTTLSFFFLPLPTFQWFSDYWEHASVVRVLSENISVPTNPHYATYDPDRQFMPFYILLGYVMQVTGMGILTAMAVGAVLTTILLVVGIRMFANAYYQHKWAPTVLLAVLLCCWGTPWVWAGFYELRTLFYNNFYPGTFVLGLTFITWGIVVQALRADKLRTLDWVLVPLLMALMFVIHQLGGMFAIGGMVLFLMFEPKASLRTRVTLFLLLAAGLAITWWWPYFNPIKLAYYGSGDKENDGVPDFYNFVKVVLLIGPAWLGVPLLIGMARKRVHLALVIGFAAVFGVYLLGGVIGHPVTHRFLSYAILYLHLPIVWKLLSMIPDRDEAPTLAQLRQDAWSGRIWLLASLFVVLHVSVAILDSSRIVYEKLSGNRIGAFPHQDVVPDSLAVAEKLPDDAIMFTTLDTGLSVKAFKGKVVSRPRPQLMIPDGAARTADNKRFFTLGTPQEERRALIRKYGATHIVLRKENVAPQVTRELIALGELVPTSGSLVMIALNKAD